MTHRVRLIIVAELDYVPHLENMSVDAFIADCEFKGLEMVYPTHGGHSVITRILDVKKDVEFEVDES